MSRSDRKRVQVLDALAGLHGANRDELEVGRVMTVRPSCVSADTNAVELVRLFHLHGFRHLLVVDGKGLLQGVVSDRDVLRWLGVGATDTVRLSTILARNLMSSDLVTISADTLVTEAIELMVEHGIGCLPIVEDGRPIGILTGTDLHIMLEMLLQTVRVTASERPFAAFAR